MKKLLCMFLSILLLLSFTACGEEEELYLDEETAQTTTNVADPTASYDYAIRLMMKTFSNDFTKEELEAMYPAACWTYFAENTGKSLDEIYTGFSERMATNWELTKKEVGEDAEVKYELLDRKDFQGEPYDIIKAEIEQRYGIEPEAFGICYEVRVKKATVGSLREDIGSQIYHVLEIDGKWYVAEVLTVMPLL